jgi:large subunit ribosomal protein L22
MDIKVSQKNIPVSPRKAAIVSDLVKGRQVQVALDMLKYDPHKVSYYLSKIIANGVAAAQDKQLDQDQLIVKNVIVDQGMKLKRMRTGSKGRGYPITKRGSILSVVLSAVEAKSTTASHAKPKTTSEKSESKEK